LVLQAREHALVLLTVIWQLVEDRIESLAQLDEFATHGIV
jgi:hypothetical protein